MNYLIHSLIPHTQITINSLKESIILYSYPPNPFPFNTILTDHNNESKRKYLHDIQTYPILFLSIQYTLIAIPSPVLSGLDGGIQKITRDRHDSSKAGRSMNLKKKPQCLVITRLKVRSTYFSGQHS